MWCSLSDPAAALLACLRFENLNADMPQRQTVRIREGQMEQYGFDRGNQSKTSATWLLQELDKGLRDLLCRRRQDFHDVQGSLEQKMNKKPYEHLIAGLDMSEALTNEGEAQTEPCPRVTVCQLQPVSLATMCQVLCQISCDLSAQLQALCSTAICKL